MRSFVLILATLGIIGGGFLIYWLFQPDAPPVQVARPGFEQVAPASQPAGSSPLRTIIGAGEGAWVKQFDEKTGNLLSQFRGAQFNPIDQGTVTVTRPEAEFFLSDGQLLRLRGESGVVVMDLPSASQAEMNPSPGGPPSRGELENVSIELFRNPDARRPLLTLELPNAEFDNDMFRISTRAYQRDGQTITADRVPVKVRGVDYDFDGQGLVIRWNERNQRLELLEIAHGGRLVIKRPDEFTASAGDFAPPSVMLAAADEAALAEELTDKGDLYRATFHNAVHISQGQEELVKADLLHVTFRLEEATHAPSAPASAPNEPKLQKAVPRQSRGRDETPKAPVTIRWDGKLRLAPRDDRPERRVPPGEALVQLVADDQAIVVQQQGQRVECATIFYATGDATFYAEGSAARPVRLIDAAGAVVQTGSMSFSPARGVASMNGASHAQIPVNREGQSQTLVARWSDSCRLTLDQTDGIRAADLTGDVSVEHPQVDLKSQELSLRLDPPTEQAGFNVRRISARGQVDCQLKDQANRQRIICSRLQLETETDAEGRLYPRGIDAEGDVHISDDQQEIKAGKLAATLSPTTRPGELNVERFSAERNVEMTGSDGGRVRAEQIAAEPNRIRLIGHPASIADAAAELSGPMIEILMREQTSSVVGSGSLVLNRAGETTSISTTQPVRLSWQSGAVLDGNRNVIDIDGPVSITTHDADAGDITARGGRMQVSLVDVASAATSAASPDPKRLRWNVDFLQNKQIGNVNLIDDVRVASILSSQEGDLLRRMTLYSSKIEYEFSTGNLFMPADGKMLYEDYFSRGQAQSDAASGATAFSWENGLRYDSASRRVIVDGDVAIVHQPPSGDDRFRLDANQVVAFLKPRESAEQTQLEIDKLVASGDLLFSAPDVEMTAETIEYDPNSRWLVGRGGDGAAPAVITHGINTLSARELQYNTLSGDIRFTGAAGMIRP